MTEPRRRREDHEEPLPLTQQRSASHGRRAVAKWVAIIVAILGGSGVAADQWGLVRMPRSREDRWRTNMERKLDWLVRQEIRRQVREGGQVMDPPEDIQ